MTQDVTNLVAELRSLVDLKEQLNDKLKEINKRLMHITQGVLPKIMGDQEVEQIRVANAGTVYLQDKLYVQINAGEMEHVIQWCKDNGHGEIVKETIHPSTRNAWAKEQYANGAALPDEMKVSYVPTAVLRRT